MPDGLRVALTPGAARTSGAGEWAARMAGRQGRVVELESYGLRTLRRELSQAEVHYLRRALLGLPPGEPLEPPGTDGQILGLVCAGKGLAREIREGTSAQRGGGAAASRAYVVADHANLTWRSPLRGPNDQTLGPRFPVTAGLYRIDEVRSRLGSTLPAAVVACVADDEAPSEFEREVALRNDMRILSTELAPVALVAAHMGFHLAALVLETGEES